MANTIAQLAVKLGLETTEFTQGIESAKSKLSDLANKIPTLAAVGVAAFAAMTAKAMQFSDQMSDLSDSTDISIASILKISQALEQSGGHADNAGKVLNKFVQSIDEAAQGSKSAQEAFSRAGVSLKDIASMSTEQLLNKTSAGIAKMGDIAAQTGTSIALMGRGIKGTDMENFNKLIQESSEEFNKYADAVANAADLHDKLAKKATQTGLIFTEKVMPVLNQMFDTINSKGGIAEEIFEAIRKVLMGLWATGVLVGKSFEYVGIVKDRVFGNINTSEMEAKLKKLDEDAKAFVQKWRKIDAGIYDVKAKASGTDTSRTVTPAKDTEADKQKQMLYTASLISGEYQRQVNFSLQQLKTRDAMVGMTTNEKKIQEAINQQLDSTSKKIDEITKLREAAAGRGADSRTLAEYDKQIEAVRKIGDESVIAARKIEESSIEAQRTFEFGWNKAFNQYAEDAGNYGKMAEDMFSSFTGNMNSALDKFVDTGKLSFSDLAQSIIKDLIKIALRMQMMQAVSSMFGGISGFFGGGPQSVSAVTTYAGPAYADGGNPSVGVPALVGERGPELFIPRSSGTIIPNNKLGDALGGGSGITYNGPVIQNMSAIDTQSALQFISNNKMAIWSANQSAVRSIPTSR
jgi:lambda family phage tail tape measure protein